MEEELLNISMVDERTHPNGWDVRGLAAAVIERAIRDYQKLDHLYYGDFDYSASAEKWFSRNEEKEYGRPFTYLWCCRVLQIDPGPLRLKLKILPNYVWDVGRNVGIKPKKPKRALPKGRALGSIG